MPFRFRPQYRAGHLPEHLTWGQWLIRLAVAASFLWWFGWL
jgi:hypothetical protein